VTEPALLIAKLLAVEQRALIANQKDIIKALARRTESSELAEQTLAAMERILVMYEKHIEHLFRADQSV
jgi:hypothetical protein